MRDSRGDVAVPAPRRDSADEAERVLDVATVLFVAHGPKMITLKWVAKDSGIDVEWIASDWPTIRDLLVAVLDRSAERASAASPIVPVIHGPGFTETADVLFDIHDRVIVRAILDDFKPAELMSHFAKVDRLVADLISNGLDESAARGPARFPSRCSRARLAPLRHDGARCVPARWRSSVLDATVQSS